MKTNIDKIINNLCKNKNEEYKVLLKNSKCNEQS